MKEIKRGFGKPHYKNGEPKTYEEQHKEGNYIDVYVILTMVGLAGGFVFFMINSI